MMSIIKFYLFCLRNLKDVNTTKQSTAMERLLETFHSQVPSYHMFNSSHIKKFSNFLHLGWKTVQICRNGKLSLLQLLPSSYHSAMKLFVPLED